MYGLIRPWLFRMDPERAHSLALRFAQRLASRPRLAEWVRNYIAKPEGRPVSVAGLRFPNRIGLAAGVDKNGLAPYAWWSFGFGFVEIGTVTPQPQAGNPAPRLERYPREHALVNRMGFNNDGAAVVAERLRMQAAHGQRPPMPIGISIGKNAQTPLEQAREDYASAANRLAPHADFLTINVSSPNTRHLRNLQAADELLGLLDAVATAAPGKPLFIKLAPEIAGTALEDIVQAIIGRAAGVIATNTLAVSESRYAFPGGLSGRPLRLLSAARVADIRRVAGDQLAIIGCGGIDDIGSARDMLNAGADLLQIYTGLIYEGPLLGARIARGLKEHKESTRR